MQTWYWPSFNVHLIVLFTGSSNTAAEPERHTPKPQGTTRYRNIKSYGNEMTSNDLLLHVYLFTVYFNITITGSGKMCLNGMIMRWIHDDMEEVFWQLKRQGKTTCNFIQDSFWTKILTMNVPGHSVGQQHTVTGALSGFGGLEVACRPLVPKFTGSNPTKAVGFFRPKKSSARLPSDGK